MDRAQFEITGQLAKKPIIKGSLKGSKYGVVMVIIREDVVMPQHIETKIRVIPVKLKEKYKQWVKFLEKGMSVTIAGRIEIARWHYKTHKGYRSFKALCLCATKIKFHGRIGRVDILKG
ncbi:MAG: hypothetical protein PF545_06335 [Elusimicrobia bacterium]|nr:hypothetical protein [Elusimicrobiota bacterium]